MYSNLLIIYSNNYIRYENYFIDKVFVYFYNMNIVIMLKYVYKSKEAILMQYVKVEGLENKVSQLIMGSDFFHPDRIEEVSEILDAYLRIGGNTIDTAYVYGGGNCEKAIGMWMKVDKNREKVNLWTRKSVV